MAKYNINGGVYSFDESLQGDALTTALQQTADYTADQNKKKFLDFLGKSEGAGYDTIVGGRQKITDYTSHPNIVGMRTSEGPSTAAGKYQITGTTYRDLAPVAGVNDFSPESQDKIALSLIERKGAMDDVMSGNFNGAIGKLGGTWASLPSSKYNQPKRSQQWVDAALAQTPTVVSDAAPSGTTYQPFAPVIKNVDQATLNTNKDWIAASRRMMVMEQAKGYQLDKSDDDIAEEGKSIMGYFNNNIVAMTARASKLVAYGTQQDKEAFLYMMDQYDATNVSLAGVGRAALGMVTDPINLVGAGTLGVATVGKIAATEAAKGAITQTLLKSLGRTGIQAGLFGGIQGAASNTITQGVEVSGGRKDGVDLASLAGHTALGAGAGLVLGTAGDALLSVAVPAVKGAVAKIAAMVGKKEVPKTSSGASSAAVKAAEDAAGVTPLGEPQIGPKTALEPQTPAATGGAEARALPTAIEAAEHTAPIPTSFTAAELQAIGTRGQKGRLWTDDLPQPMGPLDERAARALVIPESAPGLRATERNMATLTADGEKVAAQLRHLSDSELNQSLEVLRSSTSLQDAPTVFRAVQILHDESRVTLAAVVKEMQTVTPDGMAALIAKKQAIEDRMIPIQLADDAMGSFGGSINRQRQEGLVGLQGSNVESIMKDMNLSRADAERVFAGLVETSQVSSKAKQIAGEYEAKIAEALDAGDLGEVAALSLQKRMELNGVAEEAAHGGATMMQKVHHFSAGLRELLISNLFTVKTVMVNLVPSALKTLALPTMKYLVSNPLERSAIAELGAHYAAMGSTVRGAAAAAHAAFKYEQSILTRDTGRLMEGEMVMTGKVGGGLRFFPRVLNASDEFLSHLNYAGYVAGKAANKAVIDGTEKGLTGKALKDFVSEAVTAAKGKMYEAADEAKVQPIINKGVNLGLSGDELIAYAQKEASGGLDALRHGTDVEALEFSRDVLYKRGFSGGNPGDSAYKKAFSASAVTVESLMHKMPATALLIGQLFFRTPIRVFEEGIRMTPGVQILAPGFMKDLAGGNGQMRQVRAQAESLASLSIAGAALSLYASGSITGNGAYNSWKQDKARKDGPAPEPYTIKFKDGSTWSFKNMDPISTPLKILINAFEGMDELRIKEAQEQYVNKPAYKLLVARVSVATMAISAAITDANLVAGLKGTLDFASAMTDPEGDEAAMVKRVGSQLAMLVPNTLHKIAQMNDPRLRDPATFFQAIESRLGHSLIDSDTKTSYAYDPLGQVRETADVGSMWNIFSVATPEDRIRGHSEDHQKIMLMMDQLSQQTGAVFTAPVPKNPLTGDLDLRTMMTADKTETMFDRWQRNYRDLSPDKALIDIANSDLPAGTFKQKGMKVEMMQSQIKALQNAAFQQLLTDERIQSRLILEATQKAKAQGGLLDFKYRKE